MFSDISVNFRTFGQTQNTSADRFHIAIEPADAIAFFSDFAEILEESLVLRILADGDLIAGDQDHGRDIRANPIDLEVAMRDELTGLSTVFSKTKTEDDIIQTGFQ